MAYCLVQIQIRAARSGLTETLQCLDYCMLNFRMIFDNMYARMPNISLLRHVTSRGDTWLHVHHTTRYPDMLCALEILTISLYVQVGMLSC